MVWVRSLGKRAKASIRYILVLQFTASNFSEKLYTYLTLVHVSMLKIMIKVPQMEIRVPNFYCIILIKILHLNYVDSNVNDGTKLAVLLLTFSIFLLTLGTITTGRGVGKSLWSPFDF